MHIILLYNNDLTSTDIEWLEVMSPAPSFCIWAQFNTVPLEYNLVCWIGQACFQSNF